MVRVLVVTNMYPSPQSPTAGVFVEQQVKGLRELGLKVEVMMVDRLRKGFAAYLGLGWKIRAKLATWQADLIHVMYGGVMANSVTQAIQDRPVILSFCGSDLLGELLSGPIRKWASAYGVKASRRAARRATQIIVKSQNLRVALAPEIDQSKIHVIPNGIDLERFKPLDRDRCRHELNWDPARFHLLFPTNTNGDPRKRPNLALAALRELQNSGIQAELHFLANVPHEKVPIWLNASDALILSSLHEGSPNIVKEALACNLPVVSVDVGDVAERIQSVDGCFLALPDPLDLATQLRKVYGGVRRVEGRKHMAELSLARVAQRLQDVYSVALERSQCSLQPRETMLPGRAVVPLHSQSRPQT